METKLSTQSLMKLVQASKQALGLNLAPISAEPVSLISVEGFVESALSQMSDEVFLCIGPAVFLKCRAGYLNKGQLTLIARMDSSVVDDWKRALKEVDSDISLSHSSIIPADMKDKVKFPPPQMTEEEKAEVEEAQRRLSEAEQKRKEEQAKKVEERRLKELAEAEKNKQAEIAKRKREEEEARQRRKDAIARQAEEIRQGLIFLCPNCSNEIEVDAEVCPHCKEKLARCAHCNRFILKSLLDQEYPYCPHELCGKSLQKSTCPECSRGIYLDRESCPLCGKNLLMINCPNDKCLDHLGKHNQIYAGSSECHFCEKKLKTCHHCENLIEAACYEQEDPYCPICTKSLKLVTCPFCRNSVYSNRKKCNRCGKPLQVIQCPNENCVDRSGNRHLIYKGSSQCTFCEVKIVNCPHCSRPNLQAAFANSDKDPRCQHCHKSLATVKCPHCSSNTYSDMSKCGRCGKNLLQQPCPNEACVDSASERRKIYKGMSVCPFCSEELKQCPHCKDHISKMLFVVPHARCSSCHKSLEVNACPSCNQKIYAEQDACSRCGTALSIVNCPNSDCLDFNVISKQFYLGLNQCPYCSEKVFYCPHCNQVHLTSVLEQSNPTCRNKDCGKSLKKLSCPHCQKTIFADMDKCKNCGNSVEMIKCPNGKCVDEGGHRRFYRGQKECPFCETKVVLCPHCDETVKQELLDKPGSHCPHCEKSLTKLDCPKCGKQTFLDKGRCGSCKSRLKVVDCPNPDCLDSEKKKHRLFKGMSACPYCEKSLSSCPYCRVQICKKKEDHNQDCPNCSGSLAKKPCPGCGHHNYTEALRCTKCKQLLSKMHCPSCSKLIWRGYSQCPECDKHIGQCNKCQDWFVRTTRDSRCPKCQESRSG